MLAALANLHVTRTICEANLAAAQKQLNEMKTEHKFHNPENLTPEQYGASEGWRLLTTDEMRHRQCSVQMFGCLQEWRDSELNGTSFTLPCDVTYRTRAPLPHTESAWIKMSERKPTEADLPVWYAGATGKQTGFYRQLSNKEDWRYWMPAGGFVPEAPKEPTRQEEDGAAFRWWRNNTMDDISAAPAFVAGFKYERASLRSLLAKYTANDITIQQLVAEIKERVK